MDFMGPTWTRETKKALIFKGFLYVFELCWIINWWRRRESLPSNPLAFKLLKSLALNCEPVELCVTTLCKNCKENPTPNKNP